MIFVGTMANRFGDFNTEIDNVRIYQSLVAQHGEQSGTDLFNLLNPRYTDNAPTTIPGEDWSSPVPDVLASGRGEVGNASHQGEAAILHGAFAGPVISGMSNCFVLGKNKVKGANAILVNGPQFGWFTPAYVYSFGMHGAGIDVVGNAPFAYPMVMFGHNASIAWGSTWGGGDIVDIFAEELNPADAGQYQYKGSYRDLEHRTETIFVRDAEPIQLDVYRSVHGPVYQFDEPAGIAYARRSWDGREIEQLLSWVHASWASDFEAWKSEADKSSINVNMYFADTEGNIGYMYGGRYPQRAVGHDNRFPASGAGAMDWQGRLAIDFANPHVLNPSSDFIANWNNKPGQGVMNPDHYWYSWSGAHRVENLQNTLAKKIRFTPDEAWAVITSSSHADLLAPYLLPYIDAAARIWAGNDFEGDLQAAKQILQDWNQQSVDANGDGAFDHAATPIFRSFVGNLIEAVLADDLGDLYPQFANPGYGAPDAATGALTGASSNIPVGMKAVIEALGGGGDYDLLNGQSPGLLVTQSLSKALQTLQAEQGDAMTAWRLAAASLSFNTHNFLGIPQTSENLAMSIPIQQNRGTENNMVIMKKDGIIAWEVTPPGQNAFIDPAGNKGAHFDDQLELYSTFGRKRMWFYPQDVEANKRSEEVLYY